MKQFYEKQLFAIAYKYSENINIAKQYLYPGWEMINANTIQKTGVENEFLVPS